MQISEFQHPISHTGGIPTGTLQTVIPMTDVQLADTQFSDIQLPDMQAVDIELQDDQPPEIQPLGDHPSITDSTNFEVASVFASADGVTNISTNQTDSGNVSGRYY